MMMANQNAGGIKLGLVSAKFHVYQMRNAMILENQNVLKLIIMKTGADLCVMQTMIVLTQTLKNAGGIGLEKLNAKLLVHQIGIAMILQNLNVVNFTMM